MKTQSIKLILLSSILCVSSLCAGKSHSSYHWLQLKHYFLKPKAPSAIPPLKLEEVRSIDGSGNNKRNPDWGSADSLFLRLVPVAG